MSDVRPSAQSVPMLRLPNELLISILSLLNSSDLLTLTPTCRRLYDIVLHLLNHRLQEAATLQGSALLLECRQPCAQFLGGPLNCTFTGTTALSACPKNGDDDALTTARDKDCYRTQSPHSHYNTHKPLLHSLADSRTLYNRYRPHRPSFSSILARARQPPGDIPGSRTWQNYSSTSSDEETPLHSEDEGDISDDNEERLAYGSPSGGPDEPVIKTVELDSYELFTQLCVSANIVLKTDTRGLLYCYELEKGVMRVWRNWLDQRSKKTGCCSVASRGSKGKTAHSISGTHQAKQQDDILWISPKETIGLRFRVLDHHREESHDMSPSSSWSSSSSLSDDDRPARYHVVIEELLVRSSHQLLTLEKSLRW